MGQRSSSVISRRPASGKPTTEYHGILRPLSPLLKLVLAACWRPIYEDLHSPLSFYFYSSVEEARISQPPSAMTQVKKNRLIITVLKATLIICIAFVASRNFSLHNSVARSEMDQQQHFENERKKSFVVAKDPAADKSISRQRSVNSNNEINERHNLNLKNSTPSQMKQARRFEPAIVPSDYSKLPLALKPVTFNGCCPMLTRAPKKPKCGEICLTQQACNNTLYPYQSEEEKNFLRPMATESKEGLRAQCNKMNSKMHPPYQWCQQWKDDSIMRQAQKSYKRGRRRYDIDPFAAELPPPGCSIFNNGGGSGSFQHVMLFPEAKMAFCGIPKGKICYFASFLLNAIVFSRL